MPRALLGACLTTLTGAALLLAGAGTAQAGPSRGTAYAEWLDSAYPGQTVGLAVRTTDDLSDPGTTYPDGTFGVTYDNAVLQFSGHKNPGTCSVEPVVTQPGLEITVNEFVSCSESYAGVGTTKFDTFYFTVKPTVTAATTTVSAQASYGAVRSPGAAAALAITQADPRLQYVNGCTMSPDRIPTLINVKDLCNAHDVMYARFPDGHHQFGSNEWGRLQADNAFLTAMLTRCSATYRWYDPRLRACAASAAAYYSAVRIFGAAFYYDNNTRF